MWMMTDKLESEGPTGTIEFCSQPIQSTTLTITRVLHTDNAENKDTMYL